jgi:hypothetical protein
MKERSLWIHGWIVICDVTTPTKRVEDWKKMRECKPLKQRLHPQSKVERLSDAECRERGEKMWFKRSEMMSFGPRSGFR